MGDVGPFHGTRGLHQGQDQLVLFAAPRSLHQRRVEHFLPPVETLDIRTASQTLGDLLPVLAMELLHGFGQLLVFLRRPVALIRPVLVLCRASLIDVGVFTLATADLGLNLAIILLVK